jgi:hypothetical protein
MVCKGYDVFFEIAHLFKNLEVSILKGELEYRSDELWACFVIEVHCSSLLVRMFPATYVSKNLISDIPLAGFGMFKQDADSLSVDASVAEEMIMFL